MAISLPGKVVLFTTVLKFQVQPDTDAGDARVKKDQGNPGKLLRWLLKNNVYHKRNL